MTVRLTTELDAINRILVSAGEDVVAEATSGAALICKTLIDEVLHDVLLKGWNFNTEFEVELNPDNDGFIFIPTNAVNVIFSDSESSEKYAIVGTKLYNQFDQTFVFTSALTATVIYLREFTDIPEPFRVYVTKRAKRLYHSSFTAGEMLQAVTAEEADALQIARRSDSRQTRPNAFKNPTYIRFRQRGL